MDNNILNGLQLYRRKTASGLTDQNMLANMLLTRPYEVSTVLSMIFGGYNGEMYNVLDFLTTGLGRVKMIETDNREYEWPVEIDTDKAIPVMKAQWAGVDIDTSSVSTDTPGLNNTPITIWLAEKWFGPGAILAFDNRNYQVRVQGAPFQDGTDYVYTVVMADGNPTSYVPAQQFATGKKVSREGSAYEEGSEEADIVNYAAPFKLRNQLTTMRLTYDITRSAATDKMIIAYKNPQTNKESYMWTDYQDWKALRQWYETMDRFMVYSKYNARPDGTVKVMGTSGRPVYTGAGLKEQISPANKRNYTKLSASILEDFLFDLSYNKLGKGERKFVALTGEMGMKEIDRVLKDKASAYNLIDTKFVTGSGQELTLGGQFTTYKMLNGVELTFKHFPWFDNTVYNRNLHPVTGRPASSYDMMFLDFGLRDGDSNVKKVVKRGSENLMWYVGGSIAPGMNMAKSINTLRSNAKDGYSVEFLSESGIMITDPTTCGELHCDISD